MAHDYVDPESDRTVTTDELANLPAEDQQRIMLHWFRDHFEDPVESMPFDSDEGGYLFIWGGPYEAGPELEWEFGGTVDDSVIQELADELDAECLEWAPGPLHKDVLNAFVDVLAASVPFKNFNARMRTIESLAAIDYPANLVQAQYQLLLAAGVAAVEAYLAERAVRGVKLHPEVLTRFIEGHSPFKEHKISVSDVPKMSLGLEAYASNVLARIVWHRLEEARKVFTVAFALDSFPEIDRLNKIILIRHDIVHRAGVDINGSDVTMSSAELKAHLDTLGEFVDDLEPLLPIDDDTELAFRARPAHHGA